MAKYSVLIVDDDPIFTTLSKIILEDHHEISHVDIFNNCIQALEYLESTCQHSSSSEEKPLHDIIFVDLQLAHMNGFEFIERTKQVCKDLEKDSLICLVAVSTRPKDLTKANELGIDKCFDKPLTTQNIQEVLAELKS